MLRKRPLTRADLDEFIEAYGPDRSRSERMAPEDPNGRFKVFTYEDLVARDKANLDITWMKDPALDDTDSLLAPEVIAQEIVQDLQAALDEFAAITEALGGEIPADAEVE